MELLKINIAGQCLTLSITKKGGFWEVATPDPLATLIQETMDIPDIFGGGNRNKQLIKARYLYTLISIVTHKDTVQTIARKFSVPVRTAYYWETEARNQMVVSADFKHKYSTLLQKAKENPAETK